jgi:Putative zinc-finger
MFSCRHATRLISDGLDRSLSLTERLSLGGHLLGCPPCRRFRRAAHWLQKTLAAPPADLLLPAESRERIRCALEQAMGKE